MSAITDIVSGIASQIGSAAIGIRTAITGVDPATAGKLQEIAANLEAQKAAAESNLLMAQLEINKVEAASTSKFVSWWRPAIGWTGAISLALIYWPKAVVILILWARTVIQTGLLSTPPDLGLSDLIGMLGPMLGIAGLRTAEKFKGVAAS